MLEEGGIRIKDLVRFCLVKDNFGQHMYIATNKCKHLKIKNKQKSNSKRRQQP